MKKIKEHENLLKNDMSLSTMDNSQTVIGKRKGNKYKNMYKI